MATTILRLPTVKARTGLARSTIYLRMAQGTFPRPIQLGERSVGWVEDAIEAWLEGRIAASLQTHEGSGGRGGRRG
jgi:prophage regulatory protein